MAILFALEFRKFVLIEIDTRKIKRLCNSPFMFLSLIGFSPHPFVIDGWILQKFPGPSLESLSILQVALSFERPVISLHGIEHMSKRNRSVTGTIHRICRIARATHHLLTRQYLLCHDSTRHPSNRCGESCSGNHHPHRILFSIHTFSVLRLNIR